MIGPGPVGRPAVRLSQARKGANGISTNGVTTNFMFVDRGAFWVLPLTYFSLTKSARAYLFPQSVKIVTFAFAPLVLTPFVRNQQDACMSFAT